MNYKKPFIKLMDWMMLDCEQATLLTTKRLDGKLSFFEKLRLKMHVANCKFCYNFNLQSEKIDKILKATPEKLPDNCCQNQPLSPEIKKKITSKLTDNE